MEQKKFIFNDDEFGCPFAQVKYTDEISRCAIHNEDECSGNFPHWCPLRKNDIVIKLNIK